MQFEQTVGGSAAAMLLESLLLPPGGMVAVGALFLAAAGTTFFGSALLSRFDELAEREGALEPLAFLLALAAVGMLEPVARGDGW